MSHPGLPIENITFTQYSVTPGFQSYPELPTAASVSPPFTYDLIVYGLYAFYPHYVVKGLTGDLRYPDTEAPPRFAQTVLLSDHSVTFDSIYTSNILAGTVTAEVFNGFLNGTAADCLNKSFDIQHPNKKGWRLRHVCLEGPESAVFYRGRLTNSTVIELPDYWIGLVDPESITVSLTQIGYSQDLIVEKIEWGKRVIIKSGSGANIDCYYLIHGMRKDGEKLIPEYEGETPASYPGNNAQYSIVGYNYDIR
jgi:hypothetical protein